MPYMLTCPPVKQINKDNQEIITPYNGKTLGLKFNEGKAVLDGDVLDWKEDDLIRLFLQDYSHIEIKDLLNNNIMVLGDKGQLSHKTIMQELEEV